MLHVLECLWCVRLRHRLDPAGQPTERLRTMGPYFKNLRFRCCHWLQLAVTSSTNLNAWPYLAVARDTHAEESQMRKRAEEDKRQAAGCELAFFDAFADTCSLKSSACDTRAGRRANIARLLH